MTGRDRRGRGGRAARASLTLLGAGDEPALAYATLYLGAILALTAARGGEPCSSARTRLALGSTRPDLAALCLNYLAIARVEAGEADGLETMRNSIALAQAGAHHEASARGYCNLAELLLRMGRLDELERCVREGLAFTRERGFWSHAYNLEVHRCLLLVRRGDWDGAARGLRALLDDEADPGMLFAYSVPWLGRLLARRGDAAAGALLAEAWEQRAAPAAAARARLRRDRARRVGVADGRPRRRPAGRGACCSRGPSTRARRRSAASCCATCARAGLRRRAVRGLPARRTPRACAGDWRAAAAAWRRAGDPYETALELARAATPDAIAEALEHPRAARRGARGRARPRAACASSASRSRAARARPRGRTRRG